MPTPADQARLILSFTVASLVAEDRSPLFGTMLMSLHSLGDPGGRLNRQESCMEKSLGMVSFNFTYLPFAFFAFFA
jgi:hypothetical protein